MIIFFHVLQDEGEEGGLQFGEEGNGEVGIKTKEKKRTMQRWVGQVDEQGTRGDLVLEMLWAHLSVPLTQQWCAKV